MKYRRKPVNLAIKRGLQARILGRLALLLVVCVTTGAAVFYFAGSLELGSTLRMAHLRIHRFEELLLPSLGLTAALALLLGGGVSLLFPLHIVGPLPKLEAALRRIGAGDLTAQVSLRQGDVLAELAASLNATAAGLRERVEAARGQAETLSREAERLMAQRPELAEALAPLSQLGRELSRELAGFRTGE